nr:DUF3800 domain-containing protein [Candidatus Njordarchaeota archaeon]
MTIPATPTSYTLYLDSCGDRGWCQPFGKSRTHYYVIGGLALTASADLRAYQEVNRILTKYVPLPLSSEYKRELCYHHLIRGKHQYERLDHPQRLAMANEIFDLLLELKPVLFATVVDKIKMKLRYGINAYNPKIYGIQATMHRFGMFLKRQTNGVGSVMMDSEEYKNDRSLQEMVRTFKLTGIIMRGLTYQPVYEEKLDRVLNTISFSDSEASVGIQLADVCCRTTWQYFEHQKSDRFAQLAPLWNREGNRIYEPSVIPK